MVPRTGIWRTKRSASEEASLSLTQVFAVCSVYVWSASSPDAMDSAPRGHLDAPTKLMKRYISHGNSRN